VRHVAQAIWASKNTQKTTVLLGSWENQAAMGQVSDNAAMGHVSKEMQPVALRSIKKVVRTEFADHFMFVPIGPIGCV
jgi:AmiR/NasT family two-component response regulator